MLKYLRESFKRKIARRITKKYPTRIDSFDVGSYGKVKFANWQNPLVDEKSITEKNVQFFEKFLKKGDLAIDIGGNVGQISLFMGLVTGKDGLILSFDPNPYVFEILTQNATLNPDKTNIKPYNYAITETDGDFYYSSSEASFNNGGISAEKNNKHGKYSLETKIKGINLEKFLEKTYPEKLSFLKLIKIDTEGYDKEIIKSISNLIVKYKPVVISECFDKSGPEDRFEQFELFDSKGYSVFYFSDFTSDAEIVRINKKEDMLKWKGHFEVLAVYEK